MKNRYRLVRRTYGIYYSLDNASGKKESLKTTDKVKAQRLLMARNQSMEQPALNKGMAKVYLSASSPEFGTRTWSLVMEKYVASGVESTKDRKERAFRSRPFVGLHKLKLIDTSAEHFFFRVGAQEGGDFDESLLRRLHNYALHLGWLLSPVMADAAWPVVRGKKFSSITEDEHQRIIAKEGNSERRLYYELLWETGGSQSDIANLNSKRVDRENQVIAFGRQKLEGRRMGGISCLRIGQRIERILDQLPKEGDLFPKIKLEEAKHRAAEFRRRCRTLKIVGRTLHSYRYAWAERARAAGMHERDAMNHLGHKSRAVHSAYAGSSMVTVLPLEFYEAEKAKKIIKFNQDIVLGEARIERQSDELENYSRDSDRVGNRVRIV